MQSRHIPVYLLPRRLWCSLCQMEMQVIYVVSLQCDLFSSSLPPFADTLPLLNNIITFHSLAGLVDLVDRCYIEYSPYVYYAFTVSCHSHGLVSKSANCDSRPWQNRCPASMPE